MSLRHVAMGALPKPKELLPILISTHSSVAVAALLPGATCVHLARARKQHLPQRLGWEFEHVKLVDAFQNGALSYSV